jgi:predicted NACHT family NTPase
MHNPNGPIAGGVNHYEHPAAFRALFEQHLRDHLTRLLQTRGVGTEVAVQAPPADPTKYLSDLREACGEISIRGLAVGGGKAHRFPIDELYIELSAAEEGGEDRGRPHAAGHGLLKQALRRRRLAVIGDPGSGKTTFLRWIAWVVTGDRLGDTADAAADRLGLTEPYVPVPVSIAAWLEHIGSAKDLSLGPRPTRTEAATWLPHFLGQCAEDANQGLDADWFAERLKAGGALVLLDEAPDERRRELALRLIEAVAKAYPSCPVVVTSRPVAYADRSVLPGFEPIRIEPLGDEAVDAFLTRWSRACSRATPPVPSSTAGSCSRPCTPGPISVAWPATR